MSWGVWEHPQETVRYWTNVCSQGLPSLQICLRRSATGCSGSSRPSFLQAPGERASPLDA